MWFPHFHLPPSLPLPGRMLWPRSHRTQGLVVLTDQILHLKKYIFDCSGSQLPHAGCSIFAVAGGISIVLPLRGFPSCRAWPLECRASAVGFVCHAACGTLVPQPGIKPMFPELQGGFLTTGPSGKSPCVSLNKLSLTSWDLHVLTLGNKGDVYP